MRAATWQQVPCPSCGEKLFVLPASVYPRPAGGRTPAQAPRKPAHKPTPPPQNSPGTGRKATPKGKQPPPLAEPAPQWSFRLSSLHLVLLGVLVIFSLTIWWAVHSRSLHQMEEQFTAEFKGAQQALEEHELVRASVHLQQACVALDRLGRTDSVARRARQLSKEATAATELVAKPLTDLLAEAVQTRMISLEAGWQKEFSDRYKGTWVVIDAPLSPTDGVSEQAELTNEKFNVKFPLVVGRDEADLVAQFADLKLLHPKPGQRVIFAGELEEFRLSPAGTGRWEIVLRPDTGFLWANVSTLAAAGLLDAESSPTFAQAKLVLDEQAKLLKVESPDAAK